MNRRVQVKRGEVWRTDEDGSWRSIGVVERRGSNNWMAMWGNRWSGGWPSHNEAVWAILASVGADRSEWDGWAA